MTVLLRLAVLVLLVYFVQSAGVPKPNRVKSHPEEKRSNQKQRLQGNIQNQSKRTDPNSIKQTRADTRRAAKYVDKSSSKITPPKTSHKREDKHIQHSKRGNKFATKVSPQKKKVDNKKAKKTIQKKTSSVVKEFQLNEIIFKGRATNEANAFIRGNTKLGKALELVYEHAREQDLNELEDQIRRRMVRAYPR